MENLKTTPEYIPPSRTCSACTNISGLCVSCLGSGKRRTGRLPCGRCTGKGRNVRCDECRLNGIDNEQQNQRLIGEKLKHGICFSKNKNAAILKTWCGVELKRRDSMRSYDKKQLECFLCIRLSTPA